MKQVTDNIIKNQIITSAYCGSTSKVFGIIVPMNMIMNPKTMNAIALNC